MRESSAKANSFMLFKEQADIGVLSSSLAKLIAALKLHLKISLNMLA